ncbi:MAG: hypothetical protein CVU54_12600 [Deltaproteobacteria bacterium HGW-Deltaproteobacteria-12]|nr:MAG: hypothetical protein CVU54_12600 [Deltaproteobacteria bacterium HGW-Deltaproteobacteria-12]
MNNFSQQEERYGKILIATGIQKEKGLYWGWYIVAAAFVAMGINYGARYCFALFVNPMAVDLQWSRSVISLGSTVGILAYGVGGIISGRLLDRMAPRWIITIGSLLLSAAYISMSFVQTPLQFNLLFGILSGVGGSFFGVVVCNSYISKWFLKKRGVAIGIATMGIGMGTMILPFIVAPIIKGYGWRAGFVALGCLVLILGISMAQLFMTRSKPADYGLRTDGEAIVPVSALEENKEPSFSAPVQKVQFLKEVRFWVLVFCFSLAVLAEMLAFTHQVAYAIDNGIERVRAGVSISIIGLSSIAGRYFFGWIGDRLRDAKYAASIGFAVMALGLLVLMQIPTVYGLYCYAALFGFGYGSIATMMPYLLADRFGSGMLGTIYGVLTFFVVAAASIGPLLGGYLYDRLGSYDVAWQICLGMLILVTFAVMTLKKDGKKA